MSDFVLQFPSAPEVVAAVRVHPTTSLSQMAGAEFEVFLDLPPRLQADADHCLSFVPASRNESVPIRCFPQVDEPLRQAVARAGEEVL